MTQTKYTEDLWNQVICCDLLYDEKVLKGTFIAGLHGSVPHFKRPYWSSSKNATAYELVRHATSLTNLHYRVQSTDTSIVLGCRATAVETRATEESRESRQQSSMSMEDPHQAFRHCRHRRPHYRSWHSRYPTPMPVTHSALQRRHQPTMLNFAAFVSARYT